jgi:hypothetical protein
VRWLYYRFIYRRLMRLAHRHGWHHMRTIYPEGDTMVICDWCGVRDVIQRRGYKPAISTGCDQRSARTDILK